MFLMSSPNNSCTLPHSIPDSFFSELEQDFQNLWAEHEQHFQAQIPAPIPTSVLAPRRRRAPKASKALKSPRSLRQQAFLPQPIHFGKVNLGNVKLKMPNLKRPPSRWMKSAGLMAAVVGLSGASYQLVHHPAQTERPPIQKVMYQNAQTKVAAFRKEIEEGDHFVVEHSKPIQYVSKPGDTVAKISKKFHVSTNTIVKNNDSKKIDDYLTPGTKLTILPVDGIAHPVEHNDTLTELSRRYDVGLQEIIDVNHIDNPQMITEKQKIIIPNATELKPRPKPKPVRQAIADARSGREAPVVHGKTGRRLSWPTNGVVTSNFGWRWFRMHDGIDIAAPMGTSIKAAKEGRVVYSGWMGGYGYAIDIDHGNGIVTRYGHCSSLKARVGQRVSRGEVIAAMGSTGHSTGPHLHFEVHINGQAVDPRGYF